MAPQPTLKGKSNMKFGPRSALVLLSWSLFLGACETVVTTQKFTDDGLQLPYIKNTASECYYLDEFMPVPNSLVTGKSGSMRLRYYTYYAATYKDWPKKHVILSFYSKDGTCWSLFEEYFVVD